MGVERLIKITEEYLPPEKVAIIREAYDYAMKAHEGQLRKSGEPYLEHPLEVAVTLAELQMDTSTLAAALLHDVLENCGVPLQDIISEFGSEVGKLVDGVTKLGMISLNVPGEVIQRQNENTRNEQAENLRKMLVAMAEDLRVVFIKLADRLHNMKTLDALEPEKQLRIARETAEVYAPLAHRLGIWELKWQLEDLSFRYLEPVKYHQVAKLVASRRGQREQFIEQVKQILIDEFEESGFRAEISGRPKHIYSIYQKMEKYAALGKDFDDIHDLLALRVLVNTISECYTALGIIHNLWHPLPEQFDDFIANPKTNGYQSLHTAVMCQGTTPLEIQIRTYQMHRIDEYGVASHWRYKEGEKTDVRFEERISWLRQLVDWHRELSGAEEFLESVKTDIFNDQVFVYTPKGEIKDLPNGATPLDFAYRVHTDLGHRCIGAKVNGRLVPFNYQLKNGDVVEIMSTKGERGPSRDWLNPVLGYVGTSHAREKIRQWFKKQERTENIERGRELLEKSMRQLGLPFADREKLQVLFKYEELDDFYLAIGSGDITTHQIAMKLTDQEQQPKVTTSTPTRHPTSPVTVRGVDDLLTQLAQCCHPVPGDEIVGYITRSRGITIHRKDCQNIINEKEKDRLIPVEWGETDAMYPVQIQVEALDRVGLMRDISTIVAEEKLNIAAVSLTNNDNQTISIYFALEAANLAQLSRLLVRIEGIRGVTSAERIDQGATAKVGN
ncbi:MAG: bifunctional (p)ppGpp synthetase/guanosine-3',5'-bis(diphosphate) 3'-pyrophosphohydrolase [Dehalococcoidales bacterium]|nr:MAG: bifunctional (p)ppGpp synthetase/guanosine-3',5'-bis(diphosphate) 3'-pyrophosphohydrolase [Dehalococcoidales bacterium]